MKYVMVCIVFERFCVLYYYKYRYNKLLLPNIFCDFVNTEKIIFICVTILFLIICVFWVVLLANSIITMVKVMNFVFVKRNE